MAKFKQNNLELRDNQKVIFDSAKNKYISYDGVELYVNTNISGVTPIEDYHLTTKFYVDSEIATISGQIDDHSELNGLDYASAGHTGFQPTGDYATNTKVDTLSGTLDSHTGDSTIHFTEASIDKYTQSEVDALITASSGTTDHTLLTNIGTTTHTGIDAHITDSDIHFPWEDVTDAITTATGSLTSDHGDLTGLEDDDHPQYVPTDASRGFTSTVSGIDPTQYYHLTTKEYVDNYVDSATSSGTSARFFVYDATGGTSTTSSVTWTDIPFDTEVFETSDFTHAANSAEVTINTAGIYLVSYYVDCKATTTVKDTAFDAHITIDTGGGYGSLSASHSTGSTRGDGDMTTKPIGTASLVMLVEFGSGDKIKIQIKKSDAAAATMQTEVGSCGLIITSIGGAGTQGPVGPSGSGSTINVYDQSGLVDGSPFEALNFTGDGNTISGSTTVSGGVDISISSSSSETPVFGSEYNYNSSEGESSTTSNTPQEKLTLSMTDLPSGKYYIQWQFESMTDDDKDSSFAARVQLDNTTDIAELDGGAGNKWNEDYWNQSSGFYEADLDGDHDIDIDYWDIMTVAPVGVNIRKARISSWRIS